MEKEGVGKEGAGKEWAGREEEGEETVMPGHRQGIALTQLYVQIMPWSGASSTALLVLI